MRKNQIKDLKITKVTYNYDPHAMQRWIDLYVKLVREALDEEVSKSLLDEA